MTEHVKLAIIYYSSTGTVHHLAELAAKAAENAGAEVRLRKVPEHAPDAAIASNEDWAKHLAATGHVEEATLDDLVWADAILWGTPTRYGLPTAQIKQFIDTTGGLWEQGKLANKIVSSFTSTATQHGGHESTILALNNTFYHWGSIIVPPGYTDPVQFQTGNPYGTSHNAGSGPVGDAQVGGIEYQSRRTVEFARYFKLGQAAAS